MGQDIFLTTAPGGNGIKIYGVSAKYYNVPENWNVLQFYRELFQGTIAVNKNKQYYILFFFLLFFGKLVFETYDTQRIVNGNLLKNLSR